MTKFAKIGIFILSISLLFFCNKKNESKETIIKGNLKVLVDETIVPIIEDQVMVFESEYEAKIKLFPKSETEIIQSLTKDSMNVAIMSRKLSQKEMDYFVSKKLMPKQTIFATDAIAFISNKNNKDTIVALQEVLDFMKGKSNQKIKGLVFDNPNSSTVRYMNDLAGLKNSPSSGVFSFKTNDEVVKYVSENKGMIGIVGLNWLSQPMPEAEKFISNINILSVKAVNGTDYVFPSQNNLAEKKYPLARDLYIINCQGYSGLGMGFGSFITGERGQRIILKSGLLPIRIPARKIAIRKNIIKEKN